MFQSIFFKGNLRAVVKFLNRGEYGTFPLICGVEAYAPFYLCGRGG